MSLDGALNAAMSGLRVVSRQMSQGADNIANAETPGYTVKRIAAQAQLEGGVRSLGVQREVDVTLRAEARFAQSEATAAAARARLLEPVAQLQGDPQSGDSFGGVIGAVRDALVALRAAPASSVAQTAVVQAAATVVERFNQSGTMIARTRQAAHDALVRDVDEANRTIAELARLDVEARAARASGVSDAAVLDRRDAVLNRLSDLVEVRAVTGEDGGLMLILRGGSTIPLNLANNPFALAAAPLTPGSAPGSGIPPLTLFGTDVTATIKGGRIGAGLELRDRTLPLMQAELDVTASTLATRFDAQGLRLFTLDGAPSTAGAPPDASAIGYSGAVVGLAQRLGVARDVEVDPRLVRDGTHAAAAVGFVPNPPGGPSGFVTLLDNVIGRTFGITANAAGDPHPGVPTTGLGPGGDLVASFNPPARIVDHGAALAASHANVVASATDRSQEANAARTRIDALLTQREGVDVDAEIATLLQLQNAYTANARVMGVVQDMWETLFASVR